jgi:membrane peptidoglycan carboxypeptidase
MARAYATIANDGRRIDGLEFGNRPRVVQTVEVSVEPGRRQRPARSRSWTRGQACFDPDARRGAGTGKRAAIPTPIAGKTGTTDNYGDAWFVGYTPELVVAVWVGYPDALRPMLTEFNGEPVAGGTLPAEIWKAFVEKTKADDTRSFDSPPYLGGASTWVVRRDGSWQLDNGYCRGSRLVAYFSGKGPDTEADCKPNEVSVPLVVGMTKAGAEATLHAQPLDASIAYAPAKAGRLPGIVVSQDPRSGGLSAHDSVTIWVSKAEHGMLPNFVGSSITDAQREVSV